MSEVKSQKSSDRDRRLVSLSISTVEIRLGSWLSIRLRCSRELVAGVGERGQRAGGHHTEHERRRQPLQLPAVGQDLFEELLDPRTTG